MNKQTPFYNHHLKLNAKMIDFGGWDMPVQYTTITQEHNAVRNACGIFDISHMGQILVWGVGAYDYLQHLITNNLEKATVGKGIYAHLLNEKGGVIDDIFVYRIEEDKYLVIVNATRREMDFKWMQDQKNEFEVDVMEAPYGAGLALQGPKAIELLNSILTDPLPLKRFGIDEFQISGVSAHIGRTGYTGEDGVEIFAPAGHLLQIWEMIFKAGSEFGLLPCGLGARDTLRTEVAYPLYGHELDEQHTSLEAGLGWAVKLDKGNFIGRDALLKQKSDGIKTKLIGFKVESGGVARPEAQVFQNGKQIGQVTSGTFAPSLGVPIGMAYVPTEIDPEGAKLSIKMGARELSAVTAKMPFYINELKKGVKDANPDQLKFTKSHEWLAPDGTIGLSDHAQKEITDVVFVDLPKPGKNVKAGEPVCVVESVKAAFDIYAPISGKISRANQEVTKNPAIVNQSPYENGWLFAIDKSNPEDESALMSHAEYQEFIKAGVSH